MAKMGGRVNRLLIGLGIIFFCLILSCSDNSAAGSSSSENAKILAGIILDTNGVVLSNDTVVLRDIKSTDPLMSCVTDKNGSFLFSVEDIPEFSILLNSDNNYSVYKSYTEFNVDTLWDTLSIVKNGTVQLTCDLKINSDNDSLFILGTGKKIALKNVIIDTSGRWTLVIDNLPAADLSSVVISSENEFQEVATSLKVFSNENSAVLIQDNKSLHLWEIPITVSVKEVIADSFGGLDSMKNLIINQLDSASKIITELSELPGVFKFYADSFNIFTGSAIIEGNKPLGDAAHRLIYNDSTLNSRNFIRSSIGTRLHYLWLYSASYSFFEQWDLELLVHLLTEGRGAVPLQYQNVAASNFPVSHNGYTSESSVMNKDSYQSYMTDYTKAILLHNHSNIGNERVILKNAIPDTINIIDTTLTINEISVFGSLIDSDTLYHDTLINLKGIVNSLGTSFALSKNEYLNNDEIIYSTLCLISNTGKYRWLPLSEISEGWFEGNENILTINF